MNENGTRTDNLNGSTCFKSVPISGVRFGSVIGATSYRYRYRPSCSLCARIFSSFVYFVYFCSFVKKYSFSHLRDSLTFIINFFLKFYVIHDFKENK